MKHWKNVLIFALGLVLGMGMLLPWGGAEVPALAAQTDPADETMSGFVGTAGEGVPATTIIGYSIDNAADENLGSVEDLIIDLESGAIRYVIVSFGGFLGLGDSYYAVPPSMFTWMPETDTTSARLMSELTEEELTNAPIFNYDYDLSSTTWDDEIRSFWGGGLEDSAMTETDTITDTSVVTDTEIVTDIDTITDTETTTDTGMMTDTETMTDTGMMTDTGIMTDTETMTDTGSMTDTGMMTGTETMTDTGVMTDTGSMTDTETMTDTGMMTDTGSMTGTETMTDTGVMTEVMGTAEAMDVDATVIGFSGAAGESLPVSTINGYSIDSVTDENLGSVEDLIVELESGSIRYVIVSFGGFLGLGDSYYAVPPSMFTWIPETDTSAARLTTELTEEELTNAPTFDYDYDLSSTTWDDEIRSFWDTYITN